MVIAKIVVRSTKTLVVLFTKVMHMRNIVLLLKIYLQACIASKTILAWTCKNSLTCPRCLINSRYALMLSLHNDRFQLYFSYCAPTKLICPDV